MKFGQTPRGTRSIPGKVYLVGAGPGAPDLITLRAADILRRADVVFHDALVHPATLLLAQHAEKIAVGKRCGTPAAYVARPATDAQKYSAEDRASESGSTAGSSRASKVASQQSWGPAPLSGAHSAAQRFINKRLVDAARKFNTVVRLKGGDPMLFGRAQEEIAALRAAGIEHEVVPGVTAALAASAGLGVSLTRRGIARSVTFVTARVGAGEAANNWAASVARADTAVIYMGAGQAAEIAATLLAAGVPAATPVVVVENASLPEERRFALALSGLPHVAELALSGPALIMLGEVFAAAQETASVAAASTVLAAAS